MRNVLVLLVFLCAQSYGQTTPCLSLVDAMRLASEADPRMFTARAQLQQAESELIVARSFYKPQIETFLQSARGEAGLASSDFNNQLGLRVSQRIYDFGHARLSRQAASTSITAQRYEQIAVRQQAAYEAGMTFINWMRLSAELDVTGNRSTYFERELKAQEKGLEQGGATRGDVARVAAEAALALAERERLRADRGRVARRINIVSGSTLALCGEPHPTDLARTLADELLTDEFEPLWERAFRSHPVLQSVRSDIESARLKAERQDRERYPVIALVGVASLTAEDRYAQSDSRYRVGLEVSVPLYTGNAIGGRQQGAQAELNRAQAALDQEIRQLRLDISHSLQTHNMLTTQTAALGEVVIHRESEFTAASDEYNHRLITLPMLVDARLDLEAARLKHIRTQHELLEQTVTLLYLLGEAGLGALLDARQALRP